LVGPPSVIATVTGRKIVEIKNKIALA
jgi:hypothetical protein